MSRSADRSGRRCADRRRTSRSGNRENVSSGGVSHASVTASLIAENGALGCILVGLFAFLLGVCVTVLLYRLRGADERRRQDEPDDED